MGKEISLFSGYSQKENRTTNYTMLLLNLIYEENPKYLAQLFTLMFNENIGGLVGVKFMQQVKKRNSIPDGLISQPSFSIFIETKNFDWFNNKQLENHLRSISKENENQKILIALGNFEVQDDNRFSKIITICEQKYKNKILFKALTFENLINLIKELSLPKNIEDTVLDYENYLNEENLLPIWKDLLDVVNCSTSYNDISNNQVYLCPAKGGAYNHTRCKYFGIYKEKKVSKISKIRAVIDLVDTEERTIKWNNTIESSKNIINTTLQKVKNLKIDYPVRVFLLDELIETNFIKKTKGGMLGSKQYFNISSLKAKNSKELAEKLRDKCWIDFK